MNREPSRSEPWRAVAEELARGAGAVLMRYFGSAFEIGYKGAQDLVTPADRDSEAFLVGELHRRFPDHAVLAEEGGGRAQAARYRWLVDPLDGTTNFAHGYPFFTVSVGLEEALPGHEGKAGRRGPMVAAAVYDPTRDECFTAAAAGGALLNGRPIRVSEVDRLERSLLVTGFPYDLRERPEESLRYFAALLPIAQAVRRDGSAALNLCYLACGRFDAFWEIKLHAWDTAAASLVVEEAGGRVTDFADGPFDPFGIECAGSNGRVHPELLAVLGRFPRPGH
jgi:myo-inositol-1(or 4)-monophosphatase